MEEGLISVIVPTYNVEQYLAACIDSVLSQSYRYVELIVVNDGSNDFSQKIAETYAEQDQRVKAYIFEHEGLSEARNHGLSVATGEYIVFVDSDDMLLPGALEELLKILEEKGADVAEGKMVRGKVHQVVKSMKHPKIWEYDKEKAIEDVLYQKRLKASVCGKLFKRELFEGLEFEKGLMYEDLNIIYRIFERCEKIVATDYPVYFYRETEGSILNSWQPGRLDVLKVTENIENYIAEQYPGLLHAANDRRLSANFNMFALCRKHGEREHAEKCWGVIKENRVRSLLNRKVRMKNKGGIILSYLGKNIFGLIARRVYKN